jgi:hypothetical protein
MHSFFGCVQLKETEQLYIASSVELNAFTKTLSNDGTDNNTLDCQYCNMLPGAAENGNIPTVNLLRRHSCIHIM